MTQTDSVSVPAPDRVWPPRFVDVVVLDGTNLLHRCHHAMQSSGLADPDGRPLWAISGVFGYVVKTLQRWQPRKLIVAFDTPGGCPSRRELAPLYKAGRSEQAPELVDQLGRAPQIIADAGFSVSTVDGWEADDICATVAVKAASRGLTCAVVSSDKDCHQLISDSTVVVKPEGKVFDDQALTAKYGVVGRRWVEFAALVGEGSDNLDGVSGIGPKRAALVVAHFADVEDAFDDLDLVAATAGRATAVAMTSGRDVFRRNRKVATLRTDLDLGVTGVLPSAAHAAEVMRPAGLGSAFGRLERLLPA